MGRRRRDPHALEHARAKSLPVFYSTGMPRRADGFGRGLWRNSRNLEPDPVPGIDGNDIVAEIAPKGRDVVIRKTKPSAFFGTPLASYLIELGVDTLLVTGTTTTSGCVRASVIDAFSYNFRVAVVEEGSFVSIIGPSGCGKSTLFNLIAGIDTPTSGRVLIDGTDRSGQVGLVGYMLQKDLLLPWRTVLDNVVLGLELTVRRRDAAKVALPLLAQYGLGGFEQAYPGQLSGGMGLLTVVVPGGSVAADPPGTTTPR